MNGSCKPLVVHGLQQVVQGMNFECAQRVLLVCGEKDHVGQIGARQRTKYLETVHAGHLYVEENDVGRKLANFTYGRRSIGTLADDLDVRKLAKSQGDAAPRKRFVVDDQDAHSNPLGFGGDGAKRNLDACLTAGRPIALERERAIVAVQRL